MCPLVIVSVFHVGFVAVRRFHYPLFFSYTCSRRSRSSSGHVCRIPSYPRPTMLGAACDTRDSDWERRRPDDVAPSITDHARNTSGHRTPGAASRREVHGASSRRTQPRSHDLCTPVTRGLYPARWGPSLTAPCYTERLPAGENPIRSSISRYPLSIAGVGLASWGSHRAAKGLPSATASVPTSYDMTPSVDLRATLVGPHERDTRGHPTPGAASKRGGARGFVQEDTAPVSRPVHPSNTGTLPSQAGS